MNKPIVIVGGGLLGCLTALRIANTTSRDVSLLESGDHILQSLDPIEVGPDVVNNGFHSLEVPRDSGFAEFIQKTLRVPMTTRRQSRGLGIEGHMIAASAPATDWPEPLRGIVPHEPLPLESLNDTSWIPFEYQQLLSQVGQRYGGFDSGKHLLIPWFFPPNVLLQTDDEGDIFRNRVRTGEVTAFSVQPVSGLFGSVAASLRRQLSESGVETTLNSRVGASPATLRAEVRDAVGFSDFDLVWCAPAAQLLRAVAPEQFPPLVPTRRIRVLATIDVHSAGEIRPYTEVLFLDSNAIEVARMSPICSGANSFSRALVEMSFAPSDWSDVSEESLAKAVEAFGIRYRIGASLRGFREVGETYSPPKGWDTSSKRMLEGAMKAVEGLLGSIIYFAPFNMAKAWQNSRKLASLVKTSR